MVAPCLSPGLGAHWLKPSSLLDPCYPLLSCTSRIHGTAGLRLPFLRFCTACPCQVGHMHSYGQAEAARLQTLRRDVDRILAKARTAAAPAENERMPPAARVSGEEQPVLGSPPSKGNEVVEPRPTEGGACTPFS